MLGWHPLALDVSGAAVKFYGSYTEFADALANPSSDALELAKEYASVLPNGHERSIVATLMSSVARAGADGLDFLRLASSLAVAPVPIGLLEATLAEADKLEEAAASAKARSAFSQIDALSLAKDTGGDRPSRLVHALVSRVVRYESDEQIRHRRSSLRVAAFASTHGSNRMSFMLANWSKAQTMCRLAISVSL